MTARNFKQAVRGAAQFVIRTVAVASAFCGSRSKYVLRVLLRFYCERLLQFMFLTDR